jgi:tRNA(Ile)-lysidine synthase
MALLHLAGEWRDAAGVEISAATVDHALRAESRNEAEQVADWCAALSIPHHILTWVGDKPSTRLQERARQARYELLFNCARDIGADVIATAHHGDDQAETVLFRLLRGSGIAGLAGMELVSERGGVRLARPLLHLTKAELIAICESRGQNFIRDPSNEDPRFARTHLRQLLGELAQEGLDRDALLRLARRAARMEEVAERALADLTATLPASEVDRFALPFGQFAACPEEIWLRLLGQEIARIGGAQGVRLEQLEALCADLGTAFAAKVAFRTTLGGVLIDLDRRGQLSLTPEAPRRA